MVDLRRRRIDLRNLIILLLPWRKRGVSTFIRFIVARSVPDLNLHLGGSIFYLPQCDGPPNQFWFFTSLPITTLPVFSSHKQISPYHRFQTSLTQKFTLKQLEKRRKYRTWIRYRVFQLVYVIKMFFLYIWIFLYKFSLLFFLKNLWIVYHLWQKSRKLACFLLFG